MAVLLHSLLVTAYLCMAQSEWWQSQHATNYLVIGNPGVGKSTVLNGLYRSHWGDGNAIFSDWYKFGVVQAGDIRYIEAPGLEDDVMREHNSKIISQALQQDGFHKVIFVVTLENGVRPQDVANIRVVLEATDIKSYGILVNQVSPTAMGPNLQGFETSLMEGLPVKTDNILFFAARQESLAVLPQDLLNWIEMLPSSMIPKETLKEVNSGYYAALLKICSLTKALAGERSTPQWHINENPQQFRQQWAADSAQHKFQQIIENQQKFQEELEAYRTQLAAMHASGSQSQMSPPVSGTNSMFIDNPGVAEPTRLPSSMIPKETLQEVSSEMFSVTQALAEERLRTHQHIDVQAEDTGFFAAIPNLLKRTRQALQDAMHGLRDGMSGSGNPAQVLTQASGNSNLDLSVQQAEASSGSESQAASPARANSDLPLEASSEEDLEVPPPAPEEPVFYNLDLSSQQASRAYYYLDLSSHQVEASAGKELDADQVQPDLDLPLHEAESQQFGENQQKFPKELEAYDVQHDAIHGFGSESPVPLQAPSDSVSTVSSIPPEPEWHPKVLPTSAGDSSLDLSLDDQAEDTGGAAVMWESPLVRAGSAAVAIGIVPLLFPGEAGAGRPA